jgi:putative transcriptional regulator
MSPSHHPSEHHLVEHAAGRLAPGQDLVVAAHVANCESCQAEVRLGEAVGGALLDALPPEVMAPDALARALARIERPIPPAPSIPTRAAPADWIGFSSPAVDAAWRHRRWAAPGVWVAPVIRGPGRARTYLLRVAAGMAVPYHRHDGHELVTVLKGAYDDRGDLHRPGDFADNDDAVEHRPTVTVEGECVCLICADAPLVALDWVGKVFQPFVRI